MQSRFSAPAREIILENLTDIDLTAKIRMKGLSLCIMIMTIIILLFPFYVSAGNEPDSGGPDSFSNQDLERYIKPSDNNSPAPGTNVQKENQYKPSPVNKPKRDEKDLQKYWCDKGTRLRNKLEKAKDRYAEAKKNYSDKKTLYNYGKISSCRYDSAKTKLEETEKDLKEAEKNLNDVENEAHRDWIPPGWLRCQF
jgi:hypothetical protein